MGGRAYRFLQPKKLAVLNNGDKIIKTGEFALGEIAIPAPVAASDRHIPPLALQPCLCSVNGNPGASVLGKRRQRIGALGVGGGPNAHLLHPGQKGHLVDGKRPDPAS